MQLASVDFPLPVRPMMAIVGLTLALALIVDKEQQKNVHANNTTKTPLIIFV